MIAIQMTFPAGRFHATPWGRHVNEADIEWPPSPWRLIRGLIATWHRKGDHERFPESGIKKLTGCLSETLPSYHLPVVRHAHARHYMPVAGNKKSLIFDAFALVDRQAPLVTVWPDTGLDENQAALLDDLLAKLGYLGRAESWVSAVRLNEWQGGFNCYPAGEIETRPEEEIESVVLYAPYSPSDYQAHRERLIRENDLGGRITGKTKKILATLPENLMDAISLDTGYLQAVGWSAPPAARQVRYLRPYHVLNGETYRMVPLSRPVPARSARLRLVGKPLPRIEDAVRIGETFRKALIHLMDQRMKMEVPPVISGHGLAAGNAHNHAFFLPEDADRDGYIDHIHLHVPDGIPIPALSAVSRRLDKLWLDNGQEWEVIFDNAGDRIGLLDAVATVWRSETPYLHPWHKKKKFGLEDQILKECQLRGLPTPTIEQMAAIPVGRSERPRSPLHFRRFRSKRGLSQPDRQGCFLMLHFPVPIKGPLALGFGCHFGLGLFIPEP